MNVSERTSTVWPGKPAPWTEDPVIGRYRFTNAYRAADRVSQDLLRVQYHGPQDVENLVFRTLLFRFFNKSSTWELLEHSLGPLTYDTFVAERYVALLDDALAHGDRIYSAAYILPPPRLGAIRKHENHLRLISHMMTNEFAKKLYEAPTLEDVYLLIGSYPSLGPFLSFQLTIDLNYSSRLSFDEGHFVVAGPGGAQRNQEMLFGHGRYVRRGCRQVDERHAGRAMRGTRLGLSVPLRSKTEANRLPEFVLRNR